MFNMMKLLVPGWGWMIVVVLLVLSRALWMWLARLRRKNDGPILEIPGGRGGKYRFMVVLGSGGHTTEILRLLKLLEPVWDKIELVFIVADSDTTSLQRVSTLLDATMKKSIRGIHRIKRIRAVGEPLYVAIGRVPVILLQCMHAIFSEQPDFIIVNGPGTCLPIVFASLILELFLVSRRSVLMFVESFCRVKTISLSGKILYPFMDSFLLQWPPEKALQQQYPRAKYIGPLL